jgi:TPR repeat protein
MSVPIYDFAIANENETLANMETEVYYACCGKNICGGCVQSFCKSGNMKKCPFCNERTSGKTAEETVQDKMKRVEANDAGAISALADCYYHGHLGLQQDLAKALELWRQAAELGSSQAHYQLGTYYHEGGDMKRAKFHYEAAAMAGHGPARCNLGLMEIKSGNTERAVKHWMIATSTGDYNAMQCMIELFTQGMVSRDAIDSTLIAYNNSCAEMRSEARDAYIRLLIDRFDEN